MSEKAAKICEDMSDTSWAFLAADDALLEAGGHLSCCPERNALTIDGWMKRAEDLERQLATVRQSLKERAEARADPTMPRIRPDVLERLEGMAEAAFASAEDADERIEAHALDLLCKWQRNT